jgi:osmotically-inducible protein OsmY
MTRKIVALSAGLLLSATVALAQTAERKNLEVFNDVSKAVNHYVHFTIFDDVNAEVKDGVVTLTGKVTMPYKRDDIEKRVAKVDGVRAVRDRITVLPVSQFDDQLRYRIARAIYGNPSLSNYRLGPNPSIHVIVEHGHVTLTGVVMNNTDRVIVRSLVTQFGVMTVKNELRTEAEVREALEKL